jgi:hypothetical protein
MYLFLFIIDSLISAFHHGTRGLVVLLLAIPIEIFPESIMAFEKDFTLSSILSWKGVQVLIYYNQAMF